MPTDLADDQIEDYLFMLQQQHNTPSESYLKHTVYGLRFVFRLEDLDDKRVSLPAIARPNKLPLVRSRGEIKEVLKIPALLKRRKLIGLLYDCGLWCLEVRILRIKDVDLNRRMVHLRQAKGKKDRYVPTATILADGIKKYLDVEHPRNWLFNGKGDPILDGGKGGDFDSLYSHP